MSGPDPHHAIATLLTFIVFQTISVLTTFIEITKWSNSTVLVLGVLGSLLTLLFGVLTAFGDPGVIPSRHSFLDFMQSNN